MQDSEEVLRIAQYYEQRGEPEKAADMWVKAGQPDKAVRLYVQVRDAVWYFKFQCCSRAVATHCIHRPALPFRAQYIWW